MCFLLPIFHWLKSNKFIEAGQIFWKFYKIHMLLFSDFHLLEYMQKYF